MEIDGQRKKELKKGQATLKNDKAGEIIRKKKRGLATEGYIGLYRENLKERELETGFEREIKNV